MTYIIKEPGKPVVVYQGPLVSAPDWSDDAHVFSYWAVNASPRGPQHADSRWVQ